MYNNHPRDLKKVFVCQSFSEIERFKLVVAYTERLLLTRGHCLEVVVDACLTVLVNSLQNRNKLKMWALLNVIMVIGIIGLKESN